MLPIVGNGVEDPDGVALMGNFDVTHVGRSRVVGHGHRMVSRRNATGVG